MSFFFWPHCVARRILVPWPGIKPVPPAVEVQSLNHWTTREVPENVFILLSFLNNVFTAYRIVGCLSFLAAPKQCHSIVCCKQCLYYWEVFCKSYGYYSKCNVPPFFGCCLIFSSSLVISVLTIMSSDVVFFVFIQLEIR